MRSVKLCKNVGKFLLARNGESLKIICFSILQHYWPCVRVYYSLFTNDRQYCLHQLYKLSHCSPEEEVFKQILIIHSFAIKYRNHQIKEMFVLLYRTLIMTKFSHFVYTKLSLKVRKAAKIRNRCNQLQHLTQDSTWESDKNTIKHHKQEPSPFPAGEHKAAMNRRESMTNTRHK